MYYVDYKVIDLCFLFFVSVFKGIWIFILLFKRKINIILVRKINILFFLF